METTVRRDRTAFAKIDRETHRAIRQRALDEDRPVADLIRDAIRMYLATEINTQLAS